LSDSLHHSLRHPSVHEGQFKIADLASWRALMEESTHIKKIPSKLQNTRDGTAHILPAV